MVFKVDWFPPLGERNNRTENPTKLFDVRWSWTAMCVHRAVYLAGALRDKCAPQVSAQVAVPEPVPQGAVHSAQRRHALTHISPAQALRDTGKALSTKGTLLPFRSMSGLVRRGPWSLSLT